MFDLIRKSILAGVGALTVTEEKLQDMIDEVVEKGKISQQEGETLLDELQKTLQENKAKITAQIDERVKLVLDELNLPTKDDLTARNGELKTELTKIEKRLAKIEKQLRT